MADADVLVNLTLYVKGVERSLSQVSSLVKPVQRVVNRGDTVRQDIPLEALLGHTALLMGIVLGNLEVKVVDRSPVADPRLPASLHLVIRRCIRGTDVLVAHNRDRASIEIDHFCRLKMRSRSIIPTRFPVHVAEEVRGLESKVIHSIVGASASAKVEAPFQELGCFYSSDKSPLDGLVPSIPLLHLFSAVLKVEEERVTIPWWISADSEQRADEITKVVYSSIAA